MGSENEEPLDLEAEHVFLLMKKEYRISRNTRAEWYFNHLNSTVLIPKADKIEHFKGEIEIVSAVPHEPPIDWDWDTSHLYQYVITPSTVVMFLSHAYRLALCLDLSSSAATVDCIDGTTLLDDLLVSFKHCVQGLARPFIVPGSQLLFCPKIYITVIAHTPFLVSKGQQVLVAGWLLQQDNVNSLVEIVQQKLGEIETRLAFYTSLVEEQRDAQLAEAERIVGGLFESMSEKTTGIPFTNVTMTSPEVAFISILRYGMLALELLPEKSSSGIIVFTDGVFGTTDSGMLEVLLTQLRQNTISCSFVQVGSRSCHPASSEGFLPNNDLIDFFAAATFGVCINGAPEVDNGYEYRMNVYHQHFLTWGFHKSLLCSSQTVRGSKNWSISNRCFESNYIHPIQKKENECTVNCSLNSVLSCRLKEGFTIKEIVLDEEAVEVRLALPWRPSIQVEYVIRDQWPVNQASVRCEVNVQGPYDFLHDVTCRKIQSFTSRFRQLVVQSYWNLLKNLAETDQLLALLHSFSSNPSVYTVPEAIKSGVPLYYLQPNENSLVNASNDAYPQFEAFWRPICMLDLGSWQRWLHCHRIGIILQHDRQLPKHLHQPSASGRYIGIQCRQASAALHAALRDFTSFVLLENHSYIGLVCTDSEKPVSFYLVRLTHKPPCVLIRIAFLGGTAGSIRQKVISELKLVIRSLTFPQRVLPQDYSKLQSVIPCCKVLQKPAEKILLRYEKVPNDFLQATPHDPLSGSFNNNAANRRLSPTPNPIMFKSPATQWSTLSHYLYHKRWIWSIQGTAGFSLNLNSVARILSIITKMRLQEGFSFAHSASGIFTLLLEVQMRGWNNQTVPYHNEEDHADQQENCACVVQYVLFPPHPIGSYGVKDSLSEDEATEDSDVLDNSDVQFEIVTECWVEPQAGLVSKSPHERRFFEGLDYISLADSFYALDLDCISSLVTFEHLILLCQNTEKPPSTGTVESRQSGAATPYSTFRPERSSTSNASSTEAPPLVVNNSFQSSATWERRREEALKDDTVTCVPFCFQLPRLLPKCTKAKLLFSTFVQEFRLPAQYKASHADGVNELLFELLSQQLSLLGHQEVELSDSDCRLLLMNLDLQAAAHNTGKPQDSSHEADGDNEMSGTPRDASSTLRTPREASSSAISNRPSLFTVSLNTSTRSEAHPHEERNRIKSAAFKSASVTPMWRCFVKSISPSHVIIIILPASFQDLKLLMLNDEHLQSSSSYLTRVAPDSSRQTDLNNEYSLDSKSGNDEATKLQMTDDDQMTYCSQPASQHESLAPTRTNSFAGQQRPRLASQLINHSARLRAGSLDAPANDHQSHNHGHFHTCYSVGAADRRPLTKNSNVLNHSTASSPPRPGPSASSPIQSSIVYASLNLPIYIYDCPLSNLIIKILMRSFNEKINISRDHTFKDEDSPRSSEEDETDNDNQDEEDPSYLASLKTLSQYCDVIEAVYCKCLGQALFVSLQQDRMIHSRDVEAAMNLCKETLLEIDISAFIQNICGHLKDFKMKTVLDMLRAKKQRGEEGEEDGHWNFPMNLLKLHQPCTTLRHLHKLIRTRFQEILCLSFKPVPSLFDYYFYYPPDHPNTPMTAGNVLETQDISLNLDESEVVQFQRSFETENSTSRSCSPPGGRSEDGSEPLDDVEIEGDGESDNEPPAIPLFLHLTATVRVKKDVMSQSLNGLPTCLGDLMGCLPCTSPIVDLKNMKVTLDFLCLTFRSDVGELVPGPHSMRTTSFCSSSSGVLDANACPTLASQSELSEDDTDLSMEDDERTISISRQLLHLPEVQRRHVKAAIGEIEWMLRDEIVAFLLDTFPITEGTLSTVVQHVQSSAHRPSCRRKVVPLIFVLNPEESFRRFLTEFNKLAIHGHRLWEEGSYFYLTEKGMMKKLVDSVEPSLGLNFRDAIDEDSEKSPIRSLVAQTSTESSAGSIDHRVDTPVNNAGNPEEPPSPVSPIWENSGIEVHAVNTSADVTSMAVDQSTDQQQSDVPALVDSPTAKSEKKRFESGTTSILGRQSDSSSIVDSVRNTEDGYEGGSSDSDDECEWLRGLGIDKPKMPPFWLVLRVKQDAVTSYFHCRWELTPPEELLQWKQIHENLLESISALGKLINQQMLLKDLHDTRLCNQLLEPETSEDLWNDASQTGTTSHRSSRVNDDPFYRYYSEQQEQPSYLEASLKLKPGTFECRQVWESHFPLHPRLKTGPGKLNTSKGVQQLRIVLNAFSVNNRSNMFVYQEDSGNVFYLRLHESSCIGHKSNSDSISVSRSNPDEMDIQGISMSRRSSNWNVSDKGEDSTESNRRSGSFSERDSLAGDQTSLASMSLNRSSQSQWTSQQQLARREDCILLKVHGITEAGPSIKEDLVRVLQNKLDDAILEVLHSLLSRNTACKLTSDDVHFIQKPRDLPHRMFQCPVQTCVLPYLPALAYYLRQNLLECVLYTPKYMDNYAGNHFQDYSDISPAPNSDVYLYNRPQAAGNRGIACVALAIVDGRSNAVSQMNWPRPIAKTDPADMLSIGDFESFIQTNLYEVDKDNFSNKKRPGPMALLEFRIWERGHINPETLKAKLEASIKHALWDVVLEYRLLPFPLCMPTYQEGEITGQLDGLPCSEPTTPVRLHEEDSIGDPRSRSVSFSGLPPSRNPVAVTGTGIASFTNPESKWKVRHTSGSHPPTRERPTSPISSTAQVRNLNPTSPTDRVVYERSQSTSSVISSSLTTAPPELDKFESGDKGTLHPVYSSMIEKWFNTGSQYHAPAVKQLKATLLAPLTIPLLLKAFAQVCTTVASELSIKIFSSSDNGSTFVPCSICPKNSNPDRSILDTAYILIARNLSQWKESLSGEINPSDGTRVALKMQQNHQRFVSYLHDASCTPCPEATKVFQQTADAEKDQISPSLLIPRQRLLWVTVNSQSELVLWMYNFNKDGHEAISKQCTALVQWHNARWALLSSIVAQKLGLFHNQPASLRSHCHPTLQNNPFLIPSEMDSLAKFGLPPTSRDYIASNPQRKPMSHLPHLAHLEAYRDAKSVRLLNQTNYGQLGDMVQRHGAQWLEKKHSERREEFQKLFALWPPHSTGTRVSITEDVIVLFKQVARTIHYCFTPLLFLPKWRLQVARTRDPNMATVPTSGQTTELTKFRARNESGNSMNSGGKTSPTNSPPRKLRRPTDDHWHQSLCTAYLQEYVQYLHTLGFLQMEIKPLTAKRGPKSALKTQRIVAEEERMRRFSGLPGRNAQANLSPPTSASDTNALYFHKSHQGGIIICEVAVQEPFFYNKVYALEASRLVGSSSAGLPNVAPIHSTQAHYTDRFLNECDHIKVLLHLHSFTYDFHMRCLNSYVSGRQLQLKPAFHLVSFLDDFTKYYSKAPNFSRNQVVTHTLSLKDSATPGESLYDYMLNHEQRYGLKVFRMVSSTSTTDNDEVTTEYVLAKQWPFRNIHRDIGDYKQTDDYDVTLLVAHDPVAEDPMTLYLRYYVILTSKREYYPRLVIEKKPGKFRTVSTVTPPFQQKAASAPPLELAERPGDDSDATAVSPFPPPEPPPIAEHPAMHKSNSDLPVVLDKSGKSPSADVLSASNPEMSFSQRRDTSVNLVVVPEENRTSPAAAAAAAAAAAVAAVKHPNMRSPMFIRQEVINYLGYYTKHEQDMQSMMNEQAKKAEDLIRATFNQAKVHCRRDTLWCRLQDPISSANNLTYSEFRELLTLSFAEPVSSTEPQLIALLSQPVAWYQGLAKLLLSRYPENQRHFSSPDGKIQYVVILNHRLIGTAMMLFWDAQSDKAELSTLCQEIPCDAVASGMPPAMDNTGNQRQFLTQVFVEEIVNFCAFHMWSNLLG